MDKYKRTIDSCSWWLRTAGEYYFNDQSGETNYQTAYIYQNGKIIYTGDSVDLKECVRPVMWINLDD